MLQKTAAASYTEVLSRFADQNIITIATGATCAYLGDERNLREFLIADETARWLRRAGHTVVFFLIDDSLDPLNFRQLRVAVNKDEKLIERYKHWCGKPIGHLPDPWGCHETYAAHFEEELVERLRSLDCHPTLVTTVKLYERGVYTPYMNLVLDRYQEILAFLQQNFAGYTPEKLLWILCPHCHYIHETDIEGIDQKAVHIYCHCCEHSTLVPRVELQGKLNWKLDCAVRWAIFKIDAEPFSKSYMEPQTGTFAVAQALSQKFFGGHEVLPLTYGSIKMEKQLSFKLLESLPPSVLRAMLVERPATDITITRDMVVTAASRHVVLPGLNYLDFVRQVLPMWLLSPDQMTPDQRELVAYGVAMARNFLDTQVKLHLPARANIAGELPGVLGALYTLIDKVVQLRQDIEPAWDEFQEPVRQLIDSMGVHKGPALHRLRLIVGQEQGLPISRILFVLPPDYLQLLEYILHLQLRDAQRAERRHALVA